MMQIPFSIIVPVYNAQEYVSRCIKSILEQRYRNFEVIVVNDGSTDDTSKILREFCRQDRRVRVYYFPNAGVSVSRQRGSKLATGKYVLFCDADDYLSPDLLANLAKTIGDDPDVIRYQANIVNDPPHKDHERYNIPLDVATHFTSGISALKAWSIPDKKYAVYWLYCFKRELLMSFTWPQFRCYEDVALIPSIIAQAQNVISINYVGYNYIPNNVSSLTNQDDAGAQKRKAIAFAEACSFALESLAQVSKLTHEDIEFVRYDYIQRKSAMFNSLPKHLQEELYSLYWN